MSSFSALKSYLSAHIPRKLPSFSALTSYLSVHMPKKIFFVFSTQELFIDTYAHENFLRFRHKIAIYRDITLRKFPSFSAKKSVVKLAVALVSALTTWVRDAIASRNAAVATKKESASALPPEDKSRFIHSVVSGTGFPDGIPLHSIALFVWWNPRSSSSRRSLDTDKPSAGTTMRICLPIRHNSHSLTTKYVTENKYLKINNPERDQRTRNGRNFKGFVVQAHLSFLL